MSSSGVHCFNVLNFLYSCTSCLAISAESNIGWRYIHSSWHLVHSSNTSDMTLSLLFQLRILSSKGFLKVRIAWTECWLYANGGLAEYRRSFWSGKCFCNHWGWSLSTTIFLTSPLNPSRCCTPLRHVLRSIRRSRISTSGLFIGLFRRWSSKLALLRNLRYQKSASNDDQSYLFYGGPPTEALLAWSHLIGF